MLVFLVLAFIPCIFAQAIDMDAWYAHLEVETEKLWTSLDYNKNGQYDLHDVHQFIRDYDTDRDHQVTAKEFYFHFDMSEPALARVHTGLFNEYDNDQNGVVTTSDIEAVYGKMDMDKDGTVNKAEFKEYYKNLLTLLYLIQFEEQT
ncbi:uncharacterized protein LOC121384799 [Gigantopelta aegis]|uniref:uncharacterized protein LOC121384799 n=1 Tax=Gigantopelta aegis TaxID=1735272 RepID=UPI001B889D22|nr:uncharacterized protein LOC121384799 [Gigantopelta aegis]